jgi:hypothetical protein
MMAVVVTVSACGGSDDGSSASVPKPSTTTTSAPTTTTSAPTTTTSAPTTTTSAPLGGTSPALAGERFIDPEGSYEIIVRSEWPSKHGALVEGLELWSVGDPIDGFVPNINIFSEIIESDMTLDEYIELSIENAGLFIEDFELIDKQIVTAESGQVLAFMEYEGSAVGLSLRFFAVFGVRDDEAVVATLTVPPQEYTKIKAEVAPYLFTLELLS